MGVVILKFYPKSGEETEILTITDQSLNDYRSYHQHSFPSYDEELPILYRTREGIFTVSSLKDGVFIECEVASNVFKSYLDRTTQEFLRKIKEAFPEIKSPSFKFYTQ